MAKTKVRSVRKPKPQRHDPHILLETTDAPVYSTTAVIPTKRTDHDHQALIAEKNAHDLSQRFDNRAASRT